MSDEPTPTAPFGPLAPTTPREIAVWALCDKIWAEIVGPKRNSEITDSVELAARIGRVIQKDHALVLIALGYVHDDIEDTWSRAEE